MTNVGAHIRTRTSLFQHPGKKVVDGRTSSAKTRFAL
jgi:hypothetical protein